MTDEIAIHMLKSYSGMTHKTRDNDRPKLDLAIETALNLIEKQQIEIEEYKKMIDEMAEEIHRITEEIARENAEIGENSNFEFCDNKCTDKDEFIECTQCIKEYFKKKVETEGK